MSFRDDMEKFHAEMLKFPAVPQELLGSQENRKTASGTESPALEKIRKQSEDAIERMKSKIYRTVLWHIVLKDRLN